MAECARPTGEPRPAFEIYAQYFAGIAARAMQEFGDSGVAAADRRGLLDALHKRLDDPEPFSMLRVGDGEVYGSDPCPADILDEDRQIREIICR